MKIAINGGHYPGLDSGAVGDMITEAEVTEKVMHLVSENLRSVGYEILEVQEKELADIIARSQEFSSELFVSIHCNASVIANACGSEVHYLSDTGGQLAACIQTQLIDSMGTIDRGTKKSENLYVLKYTDCPAVLVELAFISNRFDEHLLIAKQDDFAGAIARGVTDYVAFISAT